MMDNFYNSPELTRQLKIEHSTDCVWTLKLNRTKEVKDKLKNAEIARHSGPVTVLKWCDKRSVTMMSTYHSSREPSTWSAQSEQCLYDVIVTWLRTQQIRERYVSHMTASTIMLDVNSHMTRSMTFTWKYEACSNNIRRNFFRGN
jgi:hypothetical protein